MSSAWLLPEHIADVLPGRAAQVEALRRGLLDTAARFGFEFVIPPMLEHIESLLSGTGHALDLQTFKLVDQLSGRTLGIRADSTPQVARIDAHLLNRQGVMRLCYCGPVLHARMSGGGSSREPLQFGAELYGYAGIEADMEVLDLALECLEVAAIDGVVVDLSDVRIVRSLLSGLLVDSARLEAVYAALAAKDAAELRSITRAFPADARRGLEALTTLYGDASVLDEALRVLPLRDPIAKAIEALATVADSVERSHDEVRVGFDLADSSGHAYYSGMHFAAYVEGASGDIVRGGRYDEIGAVFGRTRPAVGFGLDVKELAMLAPSASVRAAIGVDYAAANTIATGVGRVRDRSMREAVRSLRAQGEVVVARLPGEVGDDAGIVIDRRLGDETGRWAVRPARTDGLP